MSDDLTDKQRLFVDHYVACLNATEAAARAGYQGSRATLAVTGHENLRNPKIRAAVDAALTDSAMPASEVLARLTDQARASLDGLFSPRGTGITLDLAAAQRAGLLHLVKKYTKTDRSVSVEIYDAQAALIHLGKVHRLFVERQELSGPNGEAITVRAEDIAAARAAAQQFEQETFGDDE